MVEGAAEPPNRHQTLTAAAALSSGSGAGWQGRPSRPATTIPSLGMGREGGSANQTTAFAGMSGQKRGGGSCPGGPRRQSATAASLSLFSPFSPPLSPSLSLSPLPLPPPFFFLSSSFCLPSLQRP